MVGIEWEVEGLVGQRTLPFELSSRRVVVFVFGDDVRCSRAVATALAADKLQSVLESRHVLKVRRRHILKFRMDGMQVFMSIRENIHQGGEGDT